MKYIYIVEICRPEGLEETLNEIGNKGYKLQHIQPLNNYKGVNVNGTPKIEITYQVIAEKIQDS